MTPAHSDNDHKKMMIKMTMHRRVSAVILVLLTIISLAHLCRLVTGVDLMVGKTVIPLWISLFGFIGPAVLVGLFWWSRPDR